MTEVSDLFKVFNGPALIVTAKSDAGRSGCFVAFATQCSIYPPRLLVCLSAVNFTTTVASSARALGVHVLRRDQSALASLFGEETGDQTDKLGAVSWREGLSGAPILDECSTWLEGVVLQRVPLGDHIGYLLEVVDAQTDLTEETMHESDATSFEPGHRAEEIRSGDEGDIENLL